MSRAETRRKRAAHSVVAHPPLGQEEARAALVGAELGRPRHHVHVEVRQHLREDRYVDLGGGGLRTEGGGDPGHEGRQLAELPEVESVPLLDVP